MSSKVHSFFMRLGILLVLFMGMRIFWHTWGKEGVESSPVAEFVVPLTHYEVKPLQTEINFISEKRTEPELLSLVETKWGKLTFSTYGASLEQVIAKRLVSGTSQEIPFLFPAAYTEKGKQCFVVALAEKTPYFYTLVNRTDTPDTVKLTYKAETEDCTVNKTFIIYNNRNEIELKLELIPKKGEAHTLEPRIVYPSPFMPRLGKKEVIASVVIDRDGIFKRTVRESIDAQRGWFTPRMFGSEDTYFVNALINDNHNFVQRAYYTIVNNNDILSFLEGPVIKEPHSWTLSFYFGPKEISSFKKVDDRLNKTLGYSGFLAPVSLVLLQILQFVYSYVGNYGWAIIILIVCMQLLMVPFTVRSEKSAKQIKEYQKKLAYIQSRYKHDSVALERERMELIRKHGMPGLGGCLPIMLLRMPIFFALQQVLHNAIELYQAPFLWISDLSVSDPYYILPALVTGGMLAQASTMEASQRVQFMMMALIIGGVTTTLSSGLALYIAVSTLLGVMQTALVRFFKCV